MNLAELKEQLFAARRGGVKLELARIAACLDSLGHPERAYSSVHIGGTNGKGSTAAFVAAIAAEAGARVGRFSSPHLSRFSERFVIDGDEVEDGALLDAGQAVLRAATSVGDALTFFELVTAIGLRLFADAKVDLGVLEVGLGGRFDSTNIVSCPVAAVTGVAIDHTDYLGETLAQISAEKAGIFKPGQHAVIGCSGDRAARPVLESRARRAGVRSLRVVDDDDLRVVAESPLGLAGRFQEQNAACAAAIAECLNDAGILTNTVSDRRRGLAAARLPGRFEAVERGDGAGPVVLLDGAHNPDAARALVAAITETYARRSIRLLLGMSAGKPILEIASILAPAVASAVVTRSRNERAADPAELQRALMEARPELRVEHVATAAAGLERSRAQCASSSDLLLVCGSLFLVGEVRELLVGAARCDDAALSDPV